MRVAFLTGGLGFIALAASCSSSNDGGGPGKSSSSASSSSSSSSSGSSGADASSSSSSSSSSADAGPKAPLYGFVGQSGKITTYAVDDTTGAWTLKKENAIAGSSTFLAFDPAKRRVVATDEDGGKVRSLTFDPQTGAL